MSQLVRYAAEIVEQVGPRPAASDGEHEASKIIQERFRGLGLDAASEEFNSPTACSWVRALYHLVAAVAAALYFFAPGMTVLALIAALFALAMLVTDLLGKNPLFNMIGRGASQNIVARYVPLGDYDRRRKIIIVAHYDAGRTQLQGIKALANYHTIIRSVIRIAILVVFLAVLAGLLPLPDILKQILGLIALIAGIVSLIAALLQIVNNLLPYGEGANSNASGVAALFGIAERLMGGNGGAKPQTSRQTSATSARIGRVREQSGASGTMVAVDEGSRSGQRRAARADNQASKRVDATQRDNRRDENSESDTASSEQSTREFAAVSDGQLADAVPAAAGRERIRLAQDVGSVAGSLTKLAESEQNFAPALRVASDAVRVRAPRAASDENAATDSAQPQKTSARQTKDAGDLPDWFVAAKKRAAEKGASRRGAAKETQPVARSQFADVPLGTDTVIPSSLTREAARQKTEEKDALLREALREGTAQAVEAAGAKAQQDALEPRQQSPAGAGQPGAEQPGARQAAAEQPVVGQAAAGQAAAERAVRTLTQPTAEPGQGTMAQSEQRVSSQPVAAQPAAAQPAGAQPAAAQSVAAQPIAVQSAAAQPAGSQPAAAQPATIQPAAAQPTVNADLSGLDHSAFSVVKNALGSDPVIVPLASEPEIAANPPAQTQLPLIADETEHRRQSPRLSAIPSLIGGEAVSLPAAQAAFGEDFVPADGYFQDSNSLVSRTGSFAPLGATGTFAPVNDELLKYHSSEEDIYVDDADDYNDGEYDTKDSYAPSPQLTTMPDSRARTFFGNLGDRLSGRKKRDELEDSPSSWLGVGDDFNARKAGGEIGSWENFSDEDDNGWKGGAYGGDSAQDNSGALDDFSSELVNREVWLVATGSQEAENTGIKALLSAHPGELRNATIINIDSVGAGDLCYTVKEGTFRSQKTDHRLQNLAAAASQSSAIRLDQVSFNSYQTDAAAALTLGARAISIIGLDNDLPVAWRSKNDKLNLLDEEKIQAASDLVFEMILTL